MFYKPQRRNLNDFNNNLNLLMGMISKENKVCYLIGDLKLDLLNNHGHLPTSEFLDIMFGHMLFPLIMLPTKITLNFLKLNCQQQHEKTHVYMTGNI